MLTLDDMKAFLKDTQFGQKMIADKHAAIQAERKTEVTTIAALTARLERELPALQAAEAEALAAVVNVRKAAALAEGGWSQKHRARRSLQLSCAAAITGCQGRLRQSADPAIDKFLDELRAMTDATRNTSVASEDIFQETFAGKSFVGRRTNYVSIQNRLQDIRAAIDEAEALKLAVVEDLDAAFATIMGKIRAVETLPRTAPEA